MGVSACSSAPGGASLAVQPPVRATVQLAYETDEAASAQMAASTADNRATQTDFMPIGAPISAPAGFLDLCERSPADCTHSSVYDPDKIRTLARVALVERYKLAFAAMKASRGQSDDADRQTAAVAASEQASPAPAASDTVHYLSWSGQYESGTPLSYVAPLRGAAVPSSRGTSGYMPGLSLPAPSKGYISDFLDLSVGNTERTALSLATPAADNGQVLALNDSQPGAVASDGAYGVRLNWSSKSSSEGNGGEDMSADSLPSAPVRPISSTVAEAPSIQYDLPTAPYDWAHLHLGMPQGADTAREAQSEEATDYVRIDMRGDTARIVRSVNDEVNRIMRGATDEQVYHIADYWNAPDLVPGVRGDCEDYALEKRRLLIQHGIPAAALSIAIVKTRLGDDHAVLIVSSQQGDFVLDNLQYDVRSWRRTGYDWISRQGPGDELGWVSLEPANHAPSPWQARTVRIAYTQ
ncbi:MAG: transglutaminase-like cysteine peptidase [Asticcacaulis sp.]